MNDAKIRGESHTAPHIPAIPPAAHSVIPAGDGWRLHEARIHDDKAELSCAPIIGWRVAEDCVATPIAAATNQYERWAFPAPSMLNFARLIETPSGRFYDGAAEYSGLAQWADDLLDSRREEIPLEAPDPLS